MFTNLFNGVIGAAAVAVGVVIILVIVYAWPAGALAFVAITTVALVAGKRRNDHDTTHHLPDNDLRRHH